MIQKLPLELLDLIARQVVTKRDLASLCLVSRATNVFFTPALYNEVIVKFAPESESSTGRVSSHWIDSESAIAKLGYVRHIHFVADIHKCFIKRCNRFDVHNKLGGHPRDVGIGEASLEELEPEAILILECITPACLLSFSWELGACIPEAVCEYIRNTQPNLQNTSLITGWDCSHCWRYPSIFARGHKFKRIRRLTWIAPSGPEQLLALGIVLRANAPHFEELNLDLILWSEAQYKFQVAAKRANRVSTSSNFFAEDLLALGLHKRTTLFPKLRTLSFTQVSFRYATVELAWALNLRGLQKLVLRDCPGTSRLLGVLASAGLLKLEELEVVFNMRRDHSMVKPGILNLGGNNLALMPNLDKLYLMTRQVDRGGEVLWEAMQSSAPRSLRQLVAHYRDEEVGYLDPAIYESQDKQMPDETLDALSEYLNRANVEYLGFHAKPSGLRRIFSCRPSSIKFFHWRLSGYRKRLSDLDDEGPSSDDSFDAGTDSDSSEEDETFWNDESENVADPLDETLQNSVNTNELEDLSAPAETIRPDMDLSSDASDQDQFVPENLSLAELLYDQAIRQNDPTFSSALVAGLRSEMDDSETEQNETPPDYVLSNNHVITLDDKPEFTPRYLRRSRGYLPIDYANFLAWVFSEEGLPSLQVVVMGDMCHGGRYEASLRIFLRPQESLHHLCVLKGNEPVFCELRDHEPRFHEVIREHKQFLEACPAEPILRKDGKQPISRPGFHHFPLR